MCTSRVTKSPKKTNTELEKVGKSERSPMGNLACLFWRPCGCKVRESRSPTVDTATSADSGFDEAAAPKENSFLPNLVSALRYILINHTFSSFYNCFYSSAHFKI